jgi:hypothetical protein
MPKPRDKKEKRPGVRTVIRLPNFGAEAALGPASRTYRSLMEAYPNAPSPAVLPSQLDIEEPVDEGMDMEGADIDADADDEATGELGSEEADDGEGEDEG